MTYQVLDYFKRLSGAIGEGWTQFWFTPSDPATLSAIRFFTGLIVVYLHATLSFDLIALFGPNGMLPAADMAPLEAGSFSYLNYVSAPNELWATHLLGLAILILFAVGFWTRLTTVLGLIVFLSDIHRAPMITSLTEPIAAMVMCYLCLAPCGRRFSLDHWLALRAARNSHARTSTNELSTSATIATRLIQVHLALIILMMGFSKLSGEPWWNGMGAWLLIAREDSRLVDFTWLHTTPKLFDFWTHAIVAFELAFPLLIWLPLARPLLLALGLAIWTSLALLTGEITMALMLAVASLAFVSPDYLVACLHRNGRPAESTV